MEHYIAIGMSSNSKSDQNNTLILLDELKNLVTTLGGKIIEIFHQKRIKPDSAYFIGIGKLNEITSCAEDLLIENLIFVNELSPTQIRNIENKTNLKVFTRRDIILEIFAQHARSRLAKAEVEMAKLQHSLTRLVGSSTYLSRLGGGIGTRGPGEKKLEIDRRTIKKRMKHLEKVLKKNKMSLMIQKKRRKNVFQAALVGYTNAGKSSLLNSLTSSKVKVENKLFSTIDTTTKKLKSKNYKTHVIISDTIGFIQEIPPELIQSFKATLEEVVEADLRIIVVDISEETFMHKLSIVEKTLVRIGCENMDKIIVFNKIDISPVQIPPDHFEYIITSTKTGEGLENLRNHMLNLARIKSGK